MDMERIKLSLDDGSYCVVLMPEDMSTARISEFAAADEASALRVLDMCVNWCEDDHPGLVGPLGADTWSDYRFVVETDGSPAFPGEPSHPAWYPEVWKKAGFSPVSEYFSAIDEQPGRPRAERMQTGAEVRRWDGWGNDEVLESVHEISERAFASAPWFSPIERGAFVARFREVLKGPAGRYSAVAVLDDRIVGYVLGYPDGRGGHVLKTLVSMRPGVGTQMTDAFYDMALEAGTTHVIHALMHQSNRSLEMSAARGARTFRRYALLGREFSR